MEGMRERGAGTLLVSLDGDIFVDCRRPKWPRENAVLFWQQKECRTLR